MHRKNDVLNLLQVPAILALQGQYNIDWQLKNSKYDRVGIVDCFMPESKSVRFSGTGDAVGSRKLDVSDAKYRVKASKNF